MNLEQKPESRGYFQIWCKTNAQEVTPVYHYHDYIEICYFSKGQGIYSLKDMSFPIRDGSLVIINARTRHKLYWKGGELCAYNILFTPKFIDENLEDSDDFFQLTKSLLFKDFQDFNYEDFHISIIEYGEVESVFLNLFKEYTRRNVGSDLLIRVYMTELLIQIARIIASKINPDVYKHQNDITFRTIKFLKANFYKQLTLDQIAGEIWYSKSHLCRIFKKITTKTIYEYLNELRITEACNLLHHTNKNLTEISLAVGFPDYNSFITNFVRFIGKKPSEYRKIE